MIEKTASRRKERKAYAEIASRLNAEGIPTRTGAATRWHPTQIQRVLGRQWYR